MFWWVVLAILVVVLALGWWYDRRRRGHLGRFGRPENDAAVGEAKAQRYTRDIQGLGPGQGP